MHDIKVDIDKTVRKAGINLQMAKDTQVMSSNFPSSIRDNGLPEELPKSFVWHWDLEQKILVGMLEEIETKIRADCGEPEKAVAQE